MEYYVYLIKSKLREWNYVGFSGDIERRIRQHNAGEVQSTKAYKPFELRFAQIIDNRIEARDLEKYLKVRWNKESLLDLIE